MNFHRVSIYREKKAQGPSEAQSVPPPSLHSSSFPLQLPPSSQPRKNLLPSEMLLQRAISHPPALPSILKSSSLRSISLSRSSPPPSLQGGSSSPSVYCRSLVQRLDNDAFLTSYFWPAGRKKDAFFAVRALNVSSTRSFFVPKEERREGGEMGGQRGEGEKEDGLLYYDPGRAEFSFFDDASYIPPDRACDDPRNGLESSYREDEASVLERRRSRYLQRESLSFSFLSSSSSLLSLRYS